MKHIRPCFNKDVISGSSVLISAGQRGDKTGRLLRWTVICLGGLLPVSGMLASGAQSRVNTRSASAQSADAPKHVFILHKPRPQSNLKGSHHRDGSVSPSASTGTSPLLMFQGSGAPLSDGDYISSTSGLNTYYRFFIEVPPGLSHLVVELFDPDVGRGGATEAAQQRDRDRNGFNSSVKYTLLRPDGTTAATLSCDDASCLDDGWQSLLDSTTAQNTAAGHWELRVDMSSATTTGDDINALGIRANDGTSGSGGTELNIYAESPYGIGVNPPLSGTNSQTYTAYPYITSGCSCSENDFDYDSDEGNVGSILLMSRTMAFSETVSSTKLSQNGQWTRNDITGWTTDYQSGDYGIWTSSMAINSYVNLGTPNGNLANLYFGNYQAAANPPTSNSPANAFRIYLPNDSGNAPAKPYVEQSLTRFSGPNPPAVGQTTVATVTLTVHNPTAYNITFSSLNLVTANIPGAGVFYHGNATVTQGVLILQPSVGGTGNITWNPGTLGSADFATLAYQVSITPFSSGQRLLVTGSVASGNGTRAQYVDETGNTTQTRATFTFGPLCELAATTGLLLPCGTIRPFVTSGATGTLCPGDSTTVTVTLSGGTGPYTVTLNTGDTKTGSSPLTFTVSPTTTIGYQVASGNDSGGCPISAILSNSVTIGVHPQIVFAPTDVNPSCPATSTGSITINVSAGSGPFQYSDDGGSTFQTSNTFSNLAAGTYQLVVKDFSGCTKAGSTTLTDPTAITFTTNATNPICSGTLTGTITINASGGTGALQYSDDGGSSFQASNTFLSLGAGTYQLVVKDANGCSTSGSITLNDPPVVGFTTINLDPSCSGGSNGSITVNASGGTGTYLYSDDGGTSFQASNVFSGLGAGAYNLVVKDSNGCTSSGSVSLTAPPEVTFTTASASPICHGSASGSITVNASGGTGTLQYSDDGGSSFQASNVFSNLGAGNYNIVVMDSVGCNAGPSVVTLTDPAPILIGPTFLPGGVANAVYPDVTFTQTNGVGTVTFNETGALPTGMMFSNGVLSGTPAETGAFPITVTATDQNGCTGTTEYTLSIACSSGSVAVSPGSIPSGTINTAYAGATFSPGGGTGPYTLTETGALPSGITFSNGMLAGTPTQSGAFPITIAATDANGCAGETNYLLVINCSAGALTIGPGTLNPGTAGTTYPSVEFTPSGGSAPYTILLAGSLPAGMMFSNGTLSGTPTQTGTFTFTIAASDSAGCAGSTDYTLTIACPAITVSPGSLPSSAAGAMYPSTTFTQTAGIGSVTFSENGALPSGLTFNASNATLSGTPQQTGSFPITVTATDSNGCSVSQSYTLTITCEAITVSPNIVPSGTAGQSYNPVSFTETGGIGTATFTETGGLPSGLTLSTEGVLGGTPLQTGSFPITVTATDSNGCTGSVSLTVTVNCSTITVNPSSISAGTAGVAYNSVTFTNTGGVGMVSYGESGTLPNGLTFSGGVLSGTPLQTGTFNITVTAVDQNGCTGSRAYTLVINCPPITVNPSSVPAAVQFASYTPVQFTQTGGVGAITFSTTSVLPTGMSLSPSGVLSGTATQGGSFSVTVVATDGNGCTGSRTATLNVTNLDKCMRDNTTGAFVQFSSTTGDYLFTFCGSNGFTLSGKGTVRVGNSIIVITDNKADRRVSIQYNTATLTGRANLTVILGSGIYRSYSIIDTNPHAVCACGSA